MVLLKILEYVRLNNRIIILESQDVGIWILQVVMGSLIFRSFGDILNNYFT